MLRTAIPRLFLIVMLAAPGLAFAAPPKPVVVTRTPNGTVIQEPSSGRAVCTSDAQGKRTCRTGRYAAAKRGGQAPRPVIVSQTPNGAVIHQPSTGRTNCTTGADGVRNCRTGRYNAAKKGSGESKPAVVVRQRVY